MLRQSLYIKLPERYECVAATPPPYTHTPFLLMGGQSAEKLDRR